VRDECGGLLYFSAPAKAELPSFAPGEDCLFETEYLTWETFDP